MPYDRYSIIQRDKLNECPKVSYKRNHCAFLSLVYSHTHIHSLTHPDCCLNGHFLVIYNDISKHINVPRAKTSCLGWSLVLSLEQNYNSHRIQISFNHAGRKTRSLLALHTPLRSPHSNGSLDGDLGRTHDRHHLCVYLQVQLCLSSCAVWASTKGNPGLYYSQHYTQDCDDAHGAEGKQNAPPGNLVFDLPAIQGYGVQACVSILGCIEVSTIK